MFVFSKWSRIAVLAAAIVCARPGFGAPALTTIRDVLYKADGTRFNGTIYITWANFEAGDSTMVPTQGAIVPVVNGAFKAQLVPTTNASAGSNYSVRYSSQGKYQFNEIWAVPPSDAPLRLRDVRVSTGAIVGAPPPVTAQLGINDITGLANELSLRPLKGTAYAGSRAAVINSSGQIDGASGSLSDCVHVDGSAGPCGGGSSSSIGFADAETPGGPVDGANPTFTLQFKPTPSASLALYRNGILMRQGVDFSVSNSAITFVAAATPQPGDIITASYRFGDPLNPLGSFASPQVICSSTGQSMSSTTMTTLGTCTIPAGVLGSGDRIEARYDFGHQGTAVPFTIQVKWGASTITSRGGTAAESILAGKTDAGIYGSGAQWRTETSGTLTAFALTAGAAPDSTASPITIAFQAQFSSAAGAEIVALRNYTVIRYPAQFNP
jgi:hypothetical protein